MYQLQSVVVVDFERDHGYFVSVAGISMIQFVYASPADVAVHLSIHWDWLPRWMVFRAPFVIE